MTTATGLGNARPSFFRRVTLFLGGTAILLVLAGVMLQIGRPITGQAQEKPAAAPGKATVTGAGGQSSSARYLARVTSGSKVLMVSYDEVAHECMLRHGSEVLDNLINRKIIEAACEQYKVSVTESEVDQEIIKISKKFNMSVEEWFNMLQAEQNVTKAQYRRDIIWPMVALRKLAGSDIEVTKTELQQAFLRNYGPRVKARIIVLSNQRHAAEAWDMVSKNPDAFEDAVKKFSIDPGSRALGGAIPPIPRYSGNPLNEPIEQAAFKLKNGEISSVIQTGQQWVIVKCEGRTEQVVGSLEEVQEQLVADLKEEKTRKAVSDTFEKIRESAKIDNFLTNQTVGGKKPSTGAVPGQIRQTGAAAPGTGAPGGVKAAAGTRPGTAAPR